MEKILIKLIKALLITFAIGVITLLVAFAAVELPNWINHLRYPKLTILGILLIGTFIIAYKIQDE